MYKGHLEKTIGHVTRSEIVAIKTLKGTRSIIEQQIGVIMIKCVIYGKQDFMTVLLSKKC